MKNMRHKKRWIIAVLTTSSIIFWMLMLLAVVQKPIGKDLGNDNWIGLLPLNYNHCVIGSGWTYGATSEGCGESYVFAYRFLWFTYIPKYKRLAFR